MSNVHPPLPPPYGRPREGPPGQSFCPKFRGPLGPYRDDFDASVRDYLKAGLHTVGLPSGAAALHLVLGIAGVGRGDEFWIPSMTFVGGFFLVSELCAKPRFLNLDPASWTMNTDLLAEELVTVTRENRLPKAMLLTNLYGQSVAFDAPESLAAQYGMRLIVNNVERLGATLRDGRKAGGDAVILSCNGNKLIITSGGGMLVKRHKDWDDEARSLGWGRCRSSAHGLRATAIVENVEDGARVAGVPAKRK